MVFIRAPYVIIFNWFLSTTYCMNKRILKAFSLVSLMTMLSRIMGFMRDIVFAYFFGAAAQMDAFLVAFKIPNFMRGLFAEGAFSQAFVPVLSEYKEKTSFQETRQFIFAIFTALTVALLCVLLLFELGASFLVMLFAPGFLEEVEQFSLALNLLRVCLPYLLLISLTALFGSVLNCWRQFAVPAFTPVFLNLALITAAVASYGFSVPVKALAWGVFAAGVIQLLFQLPSLYRLDLLPRFRSFWNNAGVLKVLKLMLPALVGVSVAQISLLISTLFASFLPAGSITWLYYSERLAYFPLGVFGVALSTVIMPHLSSTHTKGAHDDFSKTLNKALKTTLFIGLPSTIGLFMLAGPLLAALFEGGRFTPEDVWMAEKSLKALALGLPAFMGIKILVSSFYARQDIKTPVRIAIIALVANIFLSAALIIPMKHVGLALAVSLSCWVNVGLLLFKLHQQAAYQADKSLPSFLYQSIFANLSMLFLLFLAPQPLEEWLAWGRGSRLWMALFWIVFAMLVYGGAFKGFSLWLNWRARKKVLEPPSSL
jgi:putative peptidoglycan lipid II flippase